MVRRTGIIEERRGRRGGLIAPPHAAMETKTKKVSAPPATMTSASSDWRTPAWLADELKRRYGPFDLDPAAAPGTSLGKRSYTRHDGGLSKPWQGVVYCNPPHARAQGESVAPWMAKAIEELDARRCPRIVMLVPSRTDTTWWHEIVIPRAAEVLFIRGRLKFHGNGASAAAPFPSVVVVFQVRKRSEGPLYRTIRPPAPKPGRAGGRAARGK